MDIAEALPQLVAKYRRGLLVPFIGSGMSVPTCASWGAFLLALAQAANHVVPDEDARDIQQGKAESTKLYRLADHCVRLLKARGPSVFAAACRTALYTDAARPVPAQTRALAEIYWPLVLSTNYDDLLLRAAQGSKTFELAGQSVEDCHRVLRSLDIVTEPVLWALQGYLGEPTLTRAPLGATQARQLESEVVIGHQQYQSVINAQPHLRRAFAEVFRRRSLLFLGSGVQEDYLVNLFGEIIHHHGRSAHTHFAVFSESRRKAINEEFFRLRLGIEPLFVADFSAIPRFLNQLSNNLCAPHHQDPRAVVSGCAPYEVSYRLHGDGVRSSDGLVLRLRNDDLALPSGDACVAVSVGKQAGGALALGSGARRVLSLAGIAETSWQRWQPVDANGLVHRHAVNPAIFAVAARASSHDRPDRRSLAIIPAALRAFLEASSQEFARVAVGLLAAGRLRPWPALFPFVMMLSAIRTFAHGERRKLTEITVGITARSVWGPLLAGKLPVEQLLSSGSASVFVFIGDPGEDPEFYAVTITGGETVRTVADKCGLGKGAWTVSVTPIAGGDGQPLSGGDSQRIDDWGELAVVPGATIAFAPAPDAAGNFTHT